MGTKRARTLANSGERLPDEALKDEELLDVDDRLLDDCQPTRGVFGHPGRDREAPEPGIDYVRRRRPSDEADTRQPPTLERVKRVEDRDEPWIGSLCNAPWGARNERNQVR